jgi:membrane peptidoglycan carboxypeptidase
MAWAIRRFGCADFQLPAAGKTGSSHDGWFAGYTSNLLCIVWVGYDDYSDLRLSGAMTAAPIWTEFMKKASALPQYEEMKPFSQPTGVVDVQLDKATNRLATPTCPDDYTAAFVAGTEPRDTCDQQNGLSGLVSRFFGGGSPKVLPPPDQAANGQNGQEAQKRKGLFGKIAGIFKDDKSSAPPPNKWSRRIPIAPDAPSFVPCARGASPGDTASRLPPTQPTSRGDRKPFLTSHNKCHAERSGDDREAIVTAESKHPYLTRLHPRVPAIGMLRLRREDLRSSAKSKHPYPHPAASTGVRPGHIPDKTGRADS